MNRRMVIAGIVVVLLGIALLGVGAYGALSSLTIHTNFTQTKAGEFVSSEIVLNATSDIIVTSPAASGGLIHARDLSLVTPTNLRGYALTANTTVGTDIYRSLSGRYYYVAFASSVPNTKIVATAAGSGLVRYGGLALLGIILIIAGAVVAVVGALRRGALPPGQAEHQWTPPAPS